MVGSGKRTSQMYQLLHPLIAHAVVDVFAAPFTLDKPTPAQALQVHRYPPLRGADRADKFADVALTLQKNKDDVQAGRVTDACEDPREKSGFRKLTRYNGRM